MANSKCRWQCPEDWSEWSQWLAAGLHARNRWRLPVLLVGILFAHGRRTVTTWLRAAGVSDDFQDYYYFLAALGRKTKSVATQLLLLVLRTLPLPDRLLAVIDDTPTKRYGPKVEGADIHHNPTPGPADQKYLYGHIWVTLSLAVRHPRFGALALPLAGDALRPPQDDGQDSQVAGLDVCHQARAGRPTGRVDRSDRQKGRKNAVDRRRWRLREGPLPETCLACRGDGHRTAAQRRGACATCRGSCDAASGVVAAVRRKYGKNKISLAKRAAHRHGWETAKCTVYGKTVTKLYKTFLATYRPVGGVIRVVIVEEDHDWYPFFSTDPNATAVEIIEAFADRATIEQDFHDVKEVWGAGQQQVRNIWTQPGGLSFESLDAHAGGTLVLEPPARRALRPQPVAVGRRRSPSVPCRSPQSLAATHHANTNYRRLPPSGGCHEKSSN